MELRHLRYFIAVAEEGSVTLAAERRLHTAQPSLSRQLRDLELEVGVALMTRSVKGIALTSAGKAFLDHARLALLQVEAARDAARRAAHPAKACFTMGFLTGHEVEWLAEAMRTLKDQLPNIDVMVSSDTSPHLAAALLAGKIDIAFMRPEANMPELAFKLLMKEPLVVALPSDHRLSGEPDINPNDLADDIYVNVSGTAPALRLVIDDYLRQTRLQPKADHEADNISAAISLIASTRGVAILPAYVKNFLPWSVIVRPIRGSAPTIDLSLGYHRDNASEMLKMFLAKSDELVARVGAK